MHRQLVGKRGERWSRGVGALDENVRRCVLKISRRCHVLSRGLTEHVKVNEKQIIPMSSTKEEVSFNLISAKLRYSDMADDYGSWLMRAVSLCGRASAWGERETRPTTNHFVILQHADLLYSLAFYTAARPISIGLWTIDL